MRTAGILDAQQNLSVLIDEVKAGQEVTITENGKPVAILTPPKVQQELKGFPDLSALRAKTNLSPEEGEKLLIRIFEEGV